MEMYEDFFVIRTPSLPLEKLSDAITNDSELRLHLSRWLQLPGVDESLYLASPSLMDRLRTWEKNPDSKQGRKIESALLKYFIRMCSRPTPFGLFAGIALGEINNQTQLVKSAQPSFRRKTRLDMFFLNELKMHVQDSSIYDLKFRPNDAHYYSGSEFRYIEAYTSNNERQFRLSEIETNEYFDFVIKNANPSVSINELVKRFVDKYRSAEPDQVTQYILQLIEASALVADLPLLLTSKEPENVVIRSLHSSNQASVANSLKDTLTTIAKIDTEGSANVTQYKHLYSELKKLNIPIKESKLFQVDTYQNYSACKLDSQLIRKLSQTLNAIHSLSRTHTNPLESFITSFNQRFEGQVVPLFKLLDDESGIGFSNETGYESALIAGLPIDNTTNNPASLPMLSELDELLIEYVCSRDSLEKSYVSLPLRRLKKLRPSSKHAKYLPASFGAIISIFKDTKDKTVTKLSNCYGPSAASLIGRFCHLDKQLEDKVVSHLKREESLSPDVIFAEIVHLPDGRPGNVIARPKLRKYEIVFMADTDIPKDFQIPVTDLYVWVEQNTIKLWSQRLQKQIVPRLSSAHNFSSRSLSVYRFLCALQYQVSTPPQLELPKTLQLLPHVPRIMIDDIIIFEETWRIPRDTLVDLKQAITNGEDGVDEFRESFSIDKCVNYHSFDNVLYIDFSNAKMLDILLSETKHLQQIELREVLHSKFHSTVIDSKSAHYNNEIIVPFLNVDAKPYETLNSSISEIIEGYGTIQRKFGPGSKWLSLHIYGGNTAVERTLLETVKQVIGQYQHLFSKWFFIRYGDPKWHIRLRFLGDAEVLWGQLLPLLNALLEPNIEAGLLDKIEVCSYEREVERYGGPNVIEQIESLFMFDSELCLAGLDRLDEYTDDIRWRLATTLLDRILTLFEYTEKQKLDFISILRDAFGQEFKETGLLRKQLGERYQTLKNTVSLDLASNFAHEKQSDTEVIQLIEAWEQKASPVIHTVRAYLKENESISVGQLLSSVFHMTNNRLFKAYGREHEFVVYDIMRRHYLSEIKSPTNIVQNK